MFFEFFVLFFLIIKKNKLFYDKSENLIYLMYLKLKNISQLKKKN